MVTNQMFPHHKVQTHEDPSRSIINRKKNRRKANVSLLFDFKLQPKQKSHVNDLEKKLIIIHSVINSFRKRI